jgi:NAD(P)-dependent dehydrogenase (short-subunit alcohol dehydrogenase family)
MAYFITGGTGFIGRHLVPLLAARGERVHVLTRPGAGARFEALRRACGGHSEQLVAVGGDLGLPGLGIDAAQIAGLTGQVRHFFHLGALYDLSDQSPGTAFETTNVEGTRHAIQLARTLRAGCFHFASSIAVAGRYRGTFTEDMFEQAEALDHPYFRSKHAAEALVRATPGLPWRIYRPGMVVGHSMTGAADKIDGPYYLFKSLQRLRNAVPSWMPLIGFEGGHINLVPVDFVAAALAHLAHAPGQDGRCFHLTDPTDRRIGAVVNLFAKVAHAPTMTLRVEPGVVAALPRLVRIGGEALAPVRHLLDELLEGLGIPKPVVGLLDYPTRFDATRAQALLSEAAIQVPPLERYAWRLWDYWERQLDPDLDRDGNLERAVRGRTILITGGSSGIGRAAALRLGQAGAEVLIVARDPDRLAAVQGEIRALGGRCSTYICDIADAQACPAFLKTLTAEHERIDILINNAGRSIRRAIDNSYERLHDFERLMRINYFAAVAVTLGVLPCMVRQGGGHIINISSIGVLSSAPRFAGYNASKAALEAFSRCAAAEYRSRGVRFTSINMPLVRTPMVAPTRLYEQLPLMEVAQAAELVVDAVIRRPERLATGLGKLAALTEFLAPNLERAVMSESYRIFSDAPSGDDGKAPERASPEMLAFASLMRGIHW